VSSDRDVVLAVDIGGTKFAAGLMTMRGELIDRTHVDVDHGLNAVDLFDSLADLVHNMLDRAADHHDVVPVAGRDDQAPLLEDRQHAGDRLGADRDVLHATRLPLALVQRRRGRDAL